MGGEARFDVRRSGRGVSPHRRRWTRRALLRFSLVAASAGAVLAGVTGAAAGAPTTFTPQGAKWARTDGSAGNYFAGMAESVPKSHAVRVFQELLNEHGADLPITGHFGPLTERAVRDFQAANKLSRTGRINFVTSRALLADTIRREAAAAGMPASLLCGHLAQESVLDPGAVGATGEDLGVAQVVLRFVPELNATTVWDEDAAIRYMARRDAAAKRKFGSWDIAVVSYNSPLRAQQWKEAGHATTAFAQEYSDNVLAGCGGVPATAAIGGPAKASPSAKSSHRPAAGTAATQTDQPAPEPAPSLTSAPEVGPAAAGQTAGQAGKQIWTRPVATVAALTPVDVQPWHAGAALLGGTGLISGLLRAYSRRRTRLRRRGGRGGRAEREGPRHARGGPRRAPVGRSLPARSLPAPRPSARPVAAPPSRRPATSGARHRAAGVR